MELLGITFPTWLTVAIPTIFLLYRYLTRDFDYFKKQGIKGPRPYPLVGTAMGWITKGLMKGDMDLRKYGKVVGGFKGSKPALTVMDPEIVKEVLIKRFSSFRNRRTVEGLGPPLDKALSLLRDDHWKHVRALMSPTFTGSRLRRMTDALFRCAVNLREGLVETCGKGDSFDIKEWSSNFTMEAIASTAFGIKLDLRKDPNNQFMKMAKKSSYGNIRDIRLILVFLAPKLGVLFSKFGMEMFPSDVAEFFTKITDDAIKYREEHPEIEAKDFLQLMIAARMDDPDVKDVMNSNRDLVQDSTGIWSKSKLTHGEVMGQSLLFFLAGYETTSVTLSYLAYNLALHPEKQDLVMAEIDSVVAGKDAIDYDMCKQMHYLRMCIDETMRMYPVAARVDREANEDVTVKGIHIRKGMTVTCAAYAMHHDPDLWPDPESFIPERFTDEAKAARDPYSYLPFGHGPRNCLGMRLAILELKMAIAAILMTHKFVKCDETEIPVKTLNISVTPANGIKLKLEARH